MKCQGEMKPYEIFVVLKNISDSPDHSTHTPVSLAAAGVAPRVGVVVARADAHVLDAGHDLLVIRLLAQIRT